MSWRIWWPVCWRRGVAKLVSNLYILTQGIGGVNNVLAYHGCTVRADMAVMGGVIKGMVLECLLYHRDVRKWLALY